MVTKGIKTGMVRERGRPLLDGGSGAMPVIPECVTGIDKRRLPPFFRYDGGRAAGA